MNLILDREFLKSLFSSEKEKRIKGIESLINRDTNLSSLNKRFAHQKEKDETLLTLYTMAFLHKNGPKSWRKLLEKGFVDDDWTDLAEVKLELEKAISPTKEVMETIRSKTFQNPVKYLREESKSKQVIEGKTTFDCTLTLNNQKKIFIECKFTSDISYQTTYFTTRNQIARSIEVGLASMNFDVKNFYFLLITPAIYMEYPGSRLYYYKMHEYKNELEALAEDIRTIQSWYDDKNLHEQLETLSKHIGWISWEDCYDIIRNSNFTRNELNKLTDFYNERLLIRDDDDSLPF
ncbi:hypothetical protein [Neobacillus ginsengisoli]|uniref:Uncharacterized protein n=1 Tax=Neobacillus ginsengisoli TaxID=904295 RepID=A0ABT9Y1Q1_9BACI|nr:hypothetical protein [Neobacillus ginsengisoli]MDQ0201074.1 hypothetical protein [Neobacillus ginsengisoli]